MMLARRNVLRQLPAEWLFSWHTALFLAGFWESQQGKGLQMLALSIDKTPEPAVAYLRKKGYTFPAAWLSPELVRVYPKPEGLPVTVVRGKDGRVVQAEKGQLFPEDVAQLARWI